MTRAVFGLTVSVVLLLSLSAEAAELFFLTGGGRVTGELLSAEKFVQPGRSSSPSIAQSNLGVGPERT